MALFANEARFFRFRVIFQAYFLLNEVGDPPFFCISDISNSSTLRGKSLRKKNQCWKIFARTSLRGCFSKNHPLKFSSKITKFCKSYPETLSHFFFDCIYSQTFWKEFEQFFFHSISEEPVSLTLKDVIIGTVDSERPLLNYY